MCGSPRGCWPAATRANPWWVPVPFDGPALEPPIRVAVTRESHGYPTHPDILAGIDRAADALSDAGYAVEQVATPSIREASRAWFGTLMTEIVHFLGPTARKYGSKTIQTLFDLRPAMWGAVDLADYREAIAERTAQTREWNLFLDRYPLVLCPFLLRSMYPWDYDAQGLEQLTDLTRASIYSTGVNYLSLPSGVVPVGFAGGLPAGVQIVGRRYREDLILDAMEVVESSVGILAHRLWEREDVTRSNAPVPD